MTTKSRSEIGEEVTLLRSQIEDYKNDKLRLKDVERQLDRTLYDLGIHQEELRSQNEELNQAYERLEGLLQKYSVLFEDSPVPYFAFDTRQRVVDANLAAASLLRSDKEDLIGNTLLTHLPRKAISVVGDHFRKVMLSGHATDEIMLGPETQTQTPYIFQSQRIADPDTRQPVSLTVLFDISQRKQAEQKIAYLAEQNRRILDSVGEGILGIGSEGFIVFANPAAGKVLGWKSDSLLGREPFELLKPNGEGGKKIFSTDSLFGMTFNDGEVRKVTGETFQNRKGGWIPVEYVVAPTFENEKISGLVVTFRDVSQQIESAKALVKAKNDAEAGSRAKSEFLSMASHELRTPMNAIMGMTDLLLASKLDAEQKEFASTIQHSGKGLLSLIDDILDLSSIDAGKQVLKHSSVNLAELINGVVGILHPSAKEKELELVANLSEEVPDAILGDERKLRQVLLHLLSNAVKFSSAGKINLSVKCVDDGAKTSSVIFAISDEGVGIAKKDLKKIFLPFTQIDSSDTRIYGGAGLGLAICERFVHGMGGTLNVASKVGQGSAFSFVLPIISPDEFLLRKKSPKYFPVKQTQDFPENCQVLVVEDDVVNRALTLGVLGQWGLKTEIAENGKIALDILKKRSFDLILMDIQMPIMDGLTATKLFRKFENKEGVSGRTPIIATTAYSLDEHREACLKAGMNAYLTKPLARHDLKVALKHWLQQREKYLVAEPANSLVVNKSVLEKLRKDMGADFKMIIELFLEVLPERRKAIRAAADALDGEAMHMQTHPLKTNCRQVGLDGLADLVENIDNLARTGKCKKTVKLLIRFEKECDLAQKTLLEEILSH
ncbi:MAG: response regulator [Magnetococcales bacterium]|nr:response regulator [Magnetococcales bacterium]